MDIERQDGHSVIDTAFLKDLKLQGASELPTFLSSPNFKDSHTLQTHSSPVN